MQMRHVMLGSPDFSILHVEDDNIDAMALERALRKIGMHDRLVHASNGEEALEILSGDRSSVQLGEAVIVVLDLNMPRMDGFELLERLRERRSLCGLVVFVMTTSDDRRDIDYAYRFNIAGYVVKSSSRALDEFSRLLSSYTNVTELPVFSFS